MRRLLLVTLLVLVGCSSSNPPPGLAFFAWLGDHDFECERLDGSPPNQRSCRSGEDVVLVRTGDTVGTFEMQGTALGLMGIDKDHVVRRLAEVFGWSDELVDRIVNTLASDGHVSMDGVEWDVTPIGDNLPSMGRDLDTLTIRVLLNDGE